MKTIRNNRKLNIIAVILAGGRGERMGKVYKQFINIDNKPTLFYSLDKFFCCTFISRVVVVVPKEKQSYAQKLIYEKYDKKKIDIIIGGKTRRDSSYNALKFIKKNKIKCDYVLFHDGVRPLLTVEMIKAVAREALKHGAAVLGSGIVNVIVEAENNFIINAFPFDTKRVFDTQTPHCYRFDWILNAHESEINKNSGSDSLENIELVFNIGKRIRIVDKFYRDIKLTYKQDVKYPFC